MFVWKPTTFHNKLDIKIKNLLENMGFNITDKNLITSHKLNELVNDYIIRENIDICSIPTGKGKRLTQEQKKL